MQRVIPSTSRDDFTEMTLYDLHAATIYSYIYRRVEQPQDAEDLLQEVFTSAFKYDNLTGLAKQQQLAWLQSVAQRRIIDRYRHNARVVLLPLEQAVETHDDSLTPEEHILLRETHEQLYAALTQLPPLQQQIVAMACVLLKSRPCLIPLKEPCARRWCVFCASCALFIHVSKEGLCDAAVR